VRVLRGRLRVCARACVCSIHLRECPSSQLYLLAQAHTDHDTPDWKLHVHVTAADMARAWDLLVKLLCRRGCRTTMKVCDRACLPPLPSRRVAAWSWAMSSRGAIFILACRRSVPCCSAASSRVDALLWCDPIAGASAGRGVAATHAWPRDHDLPAVAWHAAVRAHLQLDDRAPEGLLGADHSRGRPAAAVKRHPCRTRLCRGLAARYEWNVSPVRHLFPRPPAFLSLSHSLTLSLSHPLTLSPSHSFTHSLSHSRVLSSLAQSATSLHQIACAPSLVLPYLARVLRL
jgi:hypothetical protein